MTLLLTLACAAPAREILLPAPGADLRLANCVAQQVVDIGMDGVAEWRWIEHYDRMGRKSVVESDQRMDGSIDGQMRYTWLPDGREASSAWDGNGDGHPETVTMHVYDGNTERATVLLGGTGVLSVQHLHHDADGQLVEVIVDRGGDGRPEARDVYAWEDGVQVLLTSYLLGRAMPVASRSYAYAEGLLVEEATDLDDDGHMDVVQWTRHDPAGRRSESGWDTDNDGDTDNYSFWEYDCPSGRSAPPV